MSDVGAVRGRVIVITGGTSGIGKAAALQLAQAGARVIVVGRDAAKGDAALAAVRAAQPDADIAYWQCDLSLMANANALAARMQRDLPALDGVIHCAGVMLPKRVMTAEGLETVFAVQFFARFYLNQLLLPIMAAGGKIINVSAGGGIPLRVNFDNLRADKFYNGVYTLMHESVANDLASLKWMRLHPDRLLYSYGPFYVPTALFDGMPWWFKLMTATTGRFVATTPEHAADDIVRLMAGDYPSGMYSRNLGVVRANRYRADAQVQDRLWTVSERMIDQALQASANTAL
jgi:NAD(P)-dependent dehydrogenase (short-subunit alcohol dehydrogenase family)